MGHGGDAIVYLSDEKTVRILRPHSVIPGARPGVAMLMRDGPKQMLRYWSINATQQGSRFPRARSIRFRS